MKLNLIKQIILLNVLYFLFYVCEANINEDCIIKWGSKIECKDFKGNLYFENRLKKAVEMSLEGNYSFINIDPEFSQIGRIHIKGLNTNVLKIEQFVHLNNLKTLFVEDSNVQSLDFTLDRTKYKTKVFGNLNTLELRNLTTNFSIVDLFNISSLEKFKLSYTYIKQFSLSVLPKTLKSFTLTHSNVSSLSCDELKQFENLKHLTLSGNKLLKKFDVKCLPKSITDLNLGFNEILEIDFTNLYSLNSLYSLSIQRANFKTFDLSYLPTNIETVDLSLGKLSSVTCVRSVDFLTKLSSLNLGRNDLEHLDLTCLPSNVRELEVSGNKIKEFSCEGLEKINKIDVFTASKNQLESFDFYCLKSVNVSFVDLSENEMRTIDFRSLWKFTNVYVNFKENPLMCDCRFLTSMFYIMDQLSYKVVVDCSRDSCFTCDAQSPLADYQLNDQLVAIKLFDDAHRGCLLSEARFSQDMERISEECYFENIHDLQPTADCKGVSDGRFAYKEDLKSLQSLNISGSFTELRVDERYTSLAYLKVHTDLGLSEFNFSGLTHFADLKILDLSYNQIKSVDFDGVEKLVYLHRLYLNNNNLRKLGKEVALQNLFGLEELYLAENKIKSVEVGFLPVNLKVLDLSINKLKSFDFKEANSLFVLEHVDLSGNQITKLDIMEISKDLHYLDLSGNKIQTILYNTILYNSKVSYRSQPLKLNLVRNKINCSCDFYTSYMSIIDNGEINFNCDGNECFDCLSESTLSKYQWGDAQKLKTNLKDSKLCKDSKLSSSAKKPIASCLTFLSLFILIKFFN